MRLKLAALPVRTNDVRIVVVASLSVVNGNRILEVFFVW